ncbi:MAG TPA: integrase, partial [Acetobacteraceae bacterium]
MPNAIAGAAAVPLPPALAQATAEARDYAARSKADNTRRAYRNAWRMFDAWCRAAGLDPLPAAPETVAVFLTSFAAVRKVATLQLWLTAISRAHQTAGHPLDTRHPVLRETWAGIRRVHGAAQVQKAPAVTEDIRRMVAGLPATPIGRRDRALLLVGFAAALRRSELVALDRADVVFSRDGAT